MDTFWTLFKESVIIQAMLAMALAGAIVYLYVTGQEVPQELTSLFAVILGFYFGSKTQTWIDRK